MEKFSRRDLFKRAAALSATLARAVGNPTLFARPSGPHLDFPTEPRDRLAVASYPFRAFIERPGARSRDRKQPGMDLEEFAGMVVKRFNVRNIEPLSTHFRSLEMGYVHELRESVEKAGAHVINIPVDELRSFYDPDAGRRKEAVRAAKRWVDIAAALGSPSLRTHIVNVSKTAPDARLTSDSLREVAEYGGEKEVVINLENDDRVSEDPFFLVKVIEEVNNPYLHALPDFGNSMLTGDPKYNFDGLTAMFKHAYNISHMKDAEVDNGKLVVVDVGKTFEIAKAAGYRGYFSMEWEGQGGPYEGTQKLIDLSLKYLA
ncbi:MAG: hypothetical protein DMG23_02060 [Acidobacteria bacterium]|nr:MAG: hypothetical protein DMG23_02060 [Acidobacteriota bacterium]